MGVGSPRIARICLTGAESTGKTTLAARLAAYFGGVVMPEFGREFAEMHGTEFRRDDMVAIAMGHRAALKAIEAQAPALIIEDTDIVTTTAWARMLFERDKALIAQLKRLPASAGLYLLFDADVPFVADGTRMFEGDARRRFQMVLQAEMRERRIEPVQIEGDFAARERAAMVAVERWLNVWRRRMN